MPRQFQCDGCKIISSYPLDWRALVPIIENTSTIGDRLGEEPIYFCRTCLDSMLDAIQYIGPSTAFDY